MSLSDIKTLIKHFNFFCFFLWIINKFLKFGYKNHPNTGFIWGIIDQVHTQVSVNFYQTSQFLRNVYKQIWAISEPSSLLKNNTWQHQSLVIFFMYFQAWKPNWPSHNYLIEADTKPITMPIVFICNGFMSFIFCLCLQLQQPSC